MINAGNIPRELRDRDQWVVWRTEHRNDKPTKVPYSVKGGHAKANDPKTWATFAEAVAVAGDGYDGVGYMFSPDDPYLGVDLDDVRDTETGELHEEAQRIIEELDSYSEVSPSDTGVKIIIRATKPGERNRTSKTPWGGEIECYDERRYFAITGASIGAEDVREAQEEFDAIYARFFGKVEVDKDAADDKGEVDTPPIEHEDEEIVEKAKDHRHFRMLWEGDTSRYASGSEADLAFCATIARYTSDRDQVLRIWRASSLWREKAEREDYQARTIDKAFLDTRPRFADLHLLNDVGNARRLVSEHGHGLLFASALGWLVWDGMRWKEDATRESMRKAEASARRLFESIPTMGIHDDGYRRKLSVFANGSMNVPKLEATLKAASSQKEVVRNDRVFDSQPYRVNLLNGTLNLDTLELEEHDRSDLITRLAPVEYDPEATSEVWNAFIERILPDEELRSFVQRCAGYSLAGNPIEKYLMFAHGQQDTGKSTFLGAIETVLGDYAQTADFETFIAKKGGHGVRNDLARIRGARFVKSSEVDEGEKMAAGVVKEITGGDTIAARFLFREHFEFKVEAVLWLAANARPKVDANDDAMWRRILHVPFVESIPVAEQDKSLGHKLRQADAMRAILRWLVDGFTSYRERGIDVPAVVQAYTDEYRHEMNPLADFFEQHVTIDMREWTPWNEVKDRIVLWADEERRRVPGDVAIKGALRAAGCRDERQYRDGVRMRGWVGIRWRDDS